jgi:hypothetical protein
LSKRKAKDTGARADVVAALVRMREWLARRRSNDLAAAWAVSPYVDLAEGRCPVRARLLAFVRPGYPMWIGVLGDRCTPAQALTWLDTVIDHDTAELKAMEAK